MLLSYKGRLPQVAPSAFIEESARVIGDVVVGEEASIWFNAVIRGDIHAIRIGRRSNVQDGTVVHVSHAYPTVVGDGVTVGHNVTLHGCTVGDGALVGMGAVILDGAQVGEESIVGAGSVVPPGAVIPPRTLAVGSPAVPRRELTTAEVEYLRKSANNYIGYMQDYKISEVRGTR